MTEPRDLEWARRCAQDYADKPTDARARNAAQCLPGILAAYDAIAAHAPARLALPPELCRAPHPAQARPDLKCYLAAGHTGDHSTNQFPGNRTWRNLTPGDAQTRAAALERLADGLDVPPEIRDPHTRDELNAWNQPPERCPGFPQAHPEDARLACFRPAGHAGAHSHTPTWGRVGIDPCPARNHERRSCTKGYMHPGGHEFGPTKPIEAGPELPLGEPDPDQAPHNCRCVIGYQPATEAPSPLELEAEHYRDTTRTMKTPTAGPQPWDKCPNTPPCEHPAAYHDIESLDDPRYMCCEQGCPCGAVILVDPSARISLTEPPERAVGASEPHPEG